MTPNPCHTHIDNLDGKRGTEAVQIGYQNGGNKCNPDIKHLVRLDVQIVPRMGNLWLQRRSIE